MEESFPTARRLDNLQQSCLSLQTFFAYFCALFVRLNGESVLPSSLGAKKEKALDRRVSQTSGT